MDELMAEVCNGAPQSPVRRARLAPESGVNYVLTGLALAEDASDEVTDVSGPLPQVTHEVAEPFAAEWDVDAHTIPLSAQLGMEVPADTVQELVLVAIRRNS